MPLSPSPSSKTVSQARKIPSPPPAAMRAPHWHTDGHSSLLDLLCQWLAAGNHWKRYKGGGGVKKLEQVAPEVAKWMMEHGCPTRRDGESI